MSGELWGAIRGGRRGKLFEFLFFFHFNLFNLSLRSGFARHFFLELVGCCHSRLLVGSSAFVTDRGFLWPFPDLVGDLCCCALMLHHALICVFISGLRWVLLSSWAGYKYGALYRWFARQRQPSSGSAPAF